MTEDYVAAVPAGCSGLPRVFVIASLSRALSRGAIRRQSTRDWSMDRFFKGIEARFVRCIEAAVPIYSTVLSVADEAAVRAAAEGPLAVTGGRP
jgi:hypothetical protein